MLLTDAVNQLLSGESHLHDRIVRREVESIVEAIDCVGHDESPRHSAVLRLADVLTKSVFSSRRRSPNTSSQGSMEVSFTRISQRTPSNVLKMALMKPSSHNRLYISRVHRPLCDYGLCCIDKEESVILLRAKPNSTRIICLPSTQSNSIIDNVNLPSIVHSTSSFVHGNHHPMNYNLSNLKRVRLNR